MQIQDIETKNLDNLANLILNVISKYKNCKREYTYFNDKSSLLVVCNNTYYRRVDIVDERLELIYKARKKLEEYENSIELRMASLLDFIKEKEIYNINIKKINMILADNSIAFSIKNNISKLSPLEINKLCSIINDINLNIDKLNELMMELNFNHNEMIDMLKTK